MLILNIKLAFRNLVRNKLYSFLIIGGFAIGFAACILIGLFYRTETTVNNGFKNHDRIFRVYDVKMNRCNLDWNLFPVISSEYAAVEYACPLDYQEAENLNVKNEQTGKNTIVRYLAATTNDFFQVFSVQLLESVSGKAFTGKESIAVSRKWASSMFGNENPIGQRINISNYFFGTVSSVFEEFPANSSFRAEVILNSENENFRFSTTIYNGRKYNPINHFISLREGTSPDKFIEELNKSVTLKTLEIDSLALQRLDDIYLSELTIKSRHAKGNPTLLKIFLAVASIILFLSSINYVNYSVSMHYARLHETGIKKAFGAERRNLFAYAIIEVMLGIMISLFLAFILTDLALKQSELIFGKAMDITTADWLAIIPFFTAILVLVILINSIAPVYILSKYTVMEYLSGSGSIRNGKQTWKKVLLTFQLTVSTALIAVVLIIFRQLVFVNHYNPGFTREHLVRIDIPYKFQQTKALQQEIKKLPFVENTTVSAGCPGMINHKHGSNTGKGSFDINCIYVGEDFLKTMTIELLEGRDFLPGDLHKCCLINEKALKSFGWESIEGKRLNIVQDEGFEVIGVVRDFKFESYHQAVEPLALLLTGADDANVLSVRTTSGNTGKQVDGMAGVWKSFSPDEPFNFVFYDDFFQSMYQKEAKLASSITFFSLIAIILTCMGILGQVFMICLKRVKEIGVRKINGASVMEMLLMLNSDFLIMVVIAFIAGAPVAWYVTGKWLENFAYRTTTHWWVFILAGVISLLITLLTVSWHSLRTATRNPVESIRYE